MRNLIIGAILTHMISDAILREAEMRFHMAQLDSPDTAVRLRAGVEVCRLAGVAEAVRALAADGSLRPPPEWPLVDVVPLRCVVDGSRRWLVAGVRTLMGGVLTEEVRVEVPMREGALLEAVERGRWELGRQLAGMAL